MAHISLTSLQTAHISATSRTSESRVSKASAEDMQDDLSEVRAAQLAQPAPEIEAVDSFSLIRPKGTPYHLYQKTPELKALAERLDGPIRDANPDNLF